MPEAAPVTTARRPARSGGFGPSSGSSIFQISPWAKAPRGRLQVDRVWLHVKQAGPKAEWCMLLRFSETAAKTWSPDVSRGHYFGSPANPNPLRRHPKRGLTAALSASPTPGLSGRGTAQRKAGWRDPRARARYRQHACRTLRPGRDGGCHVGDSWVVISRRGGAAVSGARARSTGLGPG